MASIDDLFRKPNALANKRKLEVSHDPAQFYKSAKHSANGDAKGRTHATVEDEPEDGREDDDDVESGPALPAEGEEEGADDEEGRFFGGGMDRGGAAALDYIDRHDASEGQEYKEEKYDTAWLRKLALNFERRISKNAELRAKYEDDPAKFMQSEADLDEDIKSLSILSEHPELYEEFASLGCVASLVSLLAHENTDIAIDAIQVLSELTDEDVSASQEQWDSLVNAALESDILSLLLSNFGRFDEENEADRDGLYNSFGVLENLASQPALATRIGAENNMLRFLLGRMQKKEKAISQNTQYTAELLAILLQASSANRALLLTSGVSRKANGETNGDAGTNGNAATKDPDAIEILLTLLAPYRRSEPTKDSTAEEYVENLFDALTILLDDAAAKQLFIDAEGVELMLIMLREGKMAKPRALRVLDHACGGPAGAIVAEKVVDAQGLKTLFGIFMKERKMDREGLEHLLGVFASLLKNLPAESAARIRTLAKFMEKDYEKATRLVNLRREFSARISAVDEKIQQERRASTLDEYDELSRRLDAGLFLLQTIDLILAWLAAEDGGARKAIRNLLSERDESLRDVQKTLQEQMAGIEDEGEDAASQRDMLTVLVDCLN